MRVQPHGLLSTGGPLIANHTAMSPAMADGQMRNAAIVVKKNNNELRTQPAICSSIVRKPVVRAWLSKSDELDWPQSLMTLLYSSRALSRRIYPDNGAIWWSKGRL